MDEEIERLLVSVRADTGAFAWTGAEGSLPQRGVESH
jgi:hypothetical protein